VYGVDGLWVADASVMPTIPSAGTNLSTIVVATKIAEGLR
jgi:choline dehydrogenase-like flavoprotein